MVEWLKDIIKCEHFLDWPVAERGVSPIRWSCATSPPPPAELFVNLTEAHIGEIWYTITKRRMTYNSEKGLDVDKGCKNEDDLH